MRPLYHIVQEDSPAQLETRVQKLVDVGWTPQGGPFVAPWTEYLPGGVCRTAHAVCQAVVLPPVPKVTV